MSVSFYMVGICKKQLEQEAKVDKSKLIDVLGKPNIATAFVVEISIFSSTVGC